eukprot:6009012-Pyramimonas_sp.AAC.1
MIYKRTRCVPNHCDALRSEIRSRSVGPRRKRGFVPQLASLLAVPSLRGRRGSSFSSARAPRQDCEEEA